jgi:N-acetylmuramoyl-L-alanine amidase
MLTRTAVSLVALVTFTAIATGFDASAGQPPAPSIVQSRIPFPKKRKVETRRYAVRHYGLHTYRLRDPKVIVEHFTGSDSYRSAYDTFTRDVPDVELHELPGVCAHFIVDRNGVVHQLVSLRLICRHTVGLNWTAIGIEHVGRSDREILSSRRQLQASLRLTHWLQARFGIETRNVIGHSESLRSPYHHERVPALRHQTHADFSHATMMRYRRRLERASTANAPVRRRVVLGHSARGRRIAVTEIGDPATRNKLLVFGAIHGNETAGVAIALRLQRTRAPESADLWVVRNLNPDGAAAGRRQNARGVDLNRNFSRGWRPFAMRNDPEYPGPRPFSEPESRIARDLILRIRPRITIWFHQPLALVDRSGGDVAIERRFATMAHLPLRRIQALPGTATRWQNHRLPRTTAFVVELPPGSLTSRSARRYASAVRALAGSRAAGRASRR